MNETKNIRAGLHVGNLSKPSEPEVYYFNELTYQNICSLHTETLPLFQAIAGGYATLELGSITADAMRQIYNWDFSEIDKECLTNIEENLKKGSKII